MPSMCVWDWSMHCACPHARGSSAGPALRRIRRRMTLLKAMPSMCVCDWSMHCACPHARGSSAGPALRRIRRRMILLEGHALKMHMCVVLAALKVRVAMMLLHLHHSVPRHGGVQASTLIPVLPACAHTTNVRVFCICCPRHTYTNSRTHMLACAHTHTQTHARMQIHCRRRVPEAALGRLPTETDVMDESVPEEVLLDENLRKEQGHHDFYMVCMQMHICAHVRLRVRVYVHACVQEHTSQCA